jgi:DNA-binding response OmpR family regulator
MNRQQTNVSSALDVLIIDDDELICARLEHLLESVGVGSLSVTSIAEARAALKTVHVPLLILDRKLGDGDGIELCREYCAGHPGRSISILLLSSSMSDESARAAYEAGADVCLRKSCSDDELLTTVKRMLQHEDVTRRMAVLDAASPLPVEQEEARLQALHAYAVLDSPPEQAFDDLARLAMLLTDAPSAFISFVDRDRQWFKTSTGAAIGFDQRETAREHAFCATTLADPDQLLIVEDARAHPLFAQNPLVTGKPYARFYAGAPIVTSDGFVLGTVCVVHTRARTVSASQAEALLMLARQTMHLLELRQLRLRQQSSNDEAGVYRLLSVA